MMRPMKLSGGNARHDRFQISAAAEAMVAISTANQRAVTMGI